MLTSVVKTYKRSAHLRLLSTKGGFTIVEILIALVLVGVVFSIIPFSLTATEREKIQESLTKLDRAILYAANESILRNSIIRIKIEFDQNPVEYSIEFGESSRMILPQTKDTSKLSFKERELELEKVKKLDTQFAKIEEYRDSNETLPEGILLYGLGTTYALELITYGSASIYFYPNGERDGSIIIISSSEEISTLEVSPFEDITIDKYYPFSDSDQHNLDYALEAKAKGIFEAWLKK